MTTPTAPPVASRSDGCTMWLHPGIRRIGYTSCSGYYDANWRYSPLPTIMSAQQGAGIRGGVVGLPSTFGASCSYNGSPTSIDASTSWIYLLASRPLGSHLPLPACCGGRHVAARPSRLARANATVSGTN